MHAWYHCADHAHTQPPGRACHTKRHKLTHIHKRAHTQRDQSTLGPKNNQGRGDRRRKRKNAYNLLWWFSNTHTTHNTYYTRNQKPATSPPALCSSTVGQAFGEPPWL
eukprot:GDKI01010775.1.p2 GENE.GDKI01010775.1~~GDKI01010775.1.p2  ORF type:complete len:122 (-),score=26.25 GDKI01010775.1:60-383(-)